MQADEHEQRRARVVRVMLKCASALLIAAAVLGAVAPRRSTRIPVDELEARVGVARLFANEGQHDRAIAMCRSLAAGPGHPPFARLGLAAALFRKGDYAAACREYRSLLAEEPRSPVVLYDLAQSLARAGEEGEARSVARRFLEDYGSVFPGLAANARVLAGDAVPPPGGNP